MSSPNEPADNDSDFQARLLLGVSRTFALTLRCLPHSTRHPYGNAYLLCRIADTIEDEPALSATQKQAFFERFAEVVTGRAEAELFAREFGETLSSSTTANEHDLIADTARVVGITRKISATPRGILEHCVKVMTHGMAEFQHVASIRGLNDLPHLDRYCYHVAGIVGETMTALFSCHSAKIADRREKLLELSISFGQGLQMTNILKDVWEDHRRGVCWLPRDIFQKAGFDLDSMSDDGTDPGFIEGLFELIAITRHHLARALQYTLIIPRRETGIRLYCLWTLGMAVLTLRRIQATPQYKSGQEVKIPHWNVWAVLAVSKALAHSNSALKFLFRIMTRRLSGAATKNLKHARGHL